MAPPNAKVEGICKRINITKKKAIANALPNVVLLKAASLFFNSFITFFFKLFFYYLTING